MCPEPDSFRSRDFIIDQHASGLGNEKKSPCRWWLIDGCKSLFNVKPSTVPTRLIHELYAHTRAAHPERFLGAETPRRPNIPQHLPGPFKVLMKDTAGTYGNPVQATLWLCGVPHKYEIIPCGEDVTP